jgi:hypothetical protein
MPFDRSAGKLRRNAMNPERDLRVRGFQLCGAHRGCNENLRRAGRSGPTALRLPLIVT